MEGINVMKKALKHIEEGHDVALVTIISINGSTPRGIGSTMAVDKDGNLLEGTIGGGALEERVKKEVINYIREKKSGIIEYNLDSSATGDNNLPMICGGNVSIFIKVYSSKESLILVGGGHISEKIAKIGSVMGYSITVLDDRKERLTSNLFPDVDNLIHGNVVERLKEIKIDTSTIIVIVTHGHEYDEKALEAVLRSNAKYIGMIGSTNKTRRTFKNLMEKGYRKEELSRVYAPIGVDLGGETPEEIALSIIAEIQGVKNNKEMNHMYENIKRF